MIKIHWQSIIGKLIELHGVLLLMGQKLMGLLGKIKLNI